MTEPKLTIRVNLGKTINIGNYESLRVDITAEEEFHQGESYDKAFDRVYEAVAGELHKRIEEVRQRFSR